YCLIGCIYDITNRCQIQVNSGYFCGYFAVSAAFPPGPAEKPLRNKCLHFCPGQGIIEKIRTHVRISGKERTEYEKDFRQTATDPRLHQRILARARLSPLCARDRRRDG